MQEWNTFPSGIVQKGHGVWAKSSTHATPYLTVNTTLGQLFEILLFSG